MIRILIVDDNPAVRRYLRAILEQQEAWQVSGEARSGAEALQSVLQGPPDLVVLDYQMPDLNGVDVARQISEMFPKLPILMVCGVKDALVSVAGCRTVAEKAKSIDAPLKYSEYPEGDHLSVAVMAIPDIFNWLDSQRKSSSSLQ